MLDDLALINLVVAHRLEAKPLITLFDLQPQEDSHNVYVSDSGVRLIVTGMGCQNVEYSLAQWAETKPSARREMAWLNIGIAGHQSLAVGDTLIATKIISSPDNESVFPTPIIGGLRTSTVITVGQPELNYPEDAAYDMEAFAFWRSAAALGLLDLVQSYKIVSDNPESSTDKVTPNLIAELFDSASREIEHLVLQLKGLAEKQQSLVSDTPAFLNARASYRLSVNQEIQLRRLCHRFYALEIGDSLEVILSASHRDSRTLIDSLHAALGHADENYAWVGVEDLSQLEAGEGQTERNQAS